MTKMFRASGMASDASVSLVACNSLHDFCTRRSLALRMVYYNTSTSVRKANKSVGPRTTDLIARLCAMVPAGLPIRSAAEHAVLLHGILWLRDRHGRRISQALRRAVLAQHGMVLLELSVCCGPPGNKSRLRDPLLVHM